MEGEKMKSAIRLFMIFAVCGALMLPGTVMADEFKVVGKMKMGPGKHGKALGLEKGAKALSISLVNGSGKDRIKVSSLRVVINDEEIFSPSEFSAGKKTKLASANKTLEIGPDMDMVDVDVEVGGRKDSEVTLTVTAVYEETGPPVVLVMYFMDGDGDGVGSDYSILGDMYNPPDGPWVLVGGDCNDADPTSRFPGDPGCMF